MHSEGRGDGACFTRIQCRSTYDNLRRSTTFENANLNLADDQRLISNVLELKCCWNDLTELDFTEVDLLIWKPDPWTITNCDHGRRWYQATRSRQRNRWCSWSLRNSGGNGCCSFAAVGLLFRRAPGYGY